MKYFLVGIKGTGMSALACYLYDMGHTVIGSDSGDYEFNDELRKRNINVYEFNTHLMNDEFIYINISFS